MSPNARTLAEVREAIKLYIDYLDKEMTIQGVLSGFCVAAAGLFADKVLGAEPKAEILFSLQKRGYPYLVAAIGAILIAAFFFYTQRSLLAYYVGQISLGISGLSNPRNKHNWGEWVEESDTWRTWFRYRAGLAFLYAGAAECLLALMAVKQDWISAHDLFLSALVYGAVFVILPLHLWQVSKRDPGRPLRKAKSKIAASETH